VQHDNVRLVDRQCLEKTEVFGENLIPVSVCPPQIPNGLAWIKSGPPRAIAIHAKL